MNIVDLRITHIENIANNKKWRGWTIYLIKREEKYCDEKINKWKVIYNKIDEKKSLFLDQISNVLVNKWLNMQNLNPRQIFTIFVWINGNDGLQTACLS